MMFSAVGVFLALLAVTAGAHVPESATAIPDWHWRADVISVILLFGTLYGLGWARLKKAGGEVKRSQLIFYALALGAIGCALLSPLDELASHLLVAHMVQHELLMMLAPPLILLADPFPILLWGLSAGLRFHAARLLTRHAVMRHVLDFLSRMPVAWSLYVVNLWAWHHPILYEAALREAWIHDIEHILFFLTGLVFWWPIIRPSSRCTPTEDARRILYLFLAATQDTVLSGLIGLSRKILYPHYETALRLWDLTPREDQIGAGLIMFAVGSVTYLIAILVLVNALLSEGRRSRSAKGTLSHSAEKVEGRV